VRDTCNFLYCNLQVSREILITLYLRDCKRSLNNQLDWQGPSDYVSSRLIPLILLRGTLQPKGLNDLISSSSSSICGAGGNPAYRTSAFEAVCTLTPVLVPRSSPEALHTRRREKPLLTKGAIMGEKWPIKFSQTIRLPRNCWVL
jgi:hypothetical protein